MAYKITPNYFAIKYWDKQLDYPIRLHSISFDKCNFRCGFCNYSNRHLEEYIDYGEIEFEKTILELIKTSKYFKFTGGEPTLNKNLVRDISLVKKHGGHVFLDSNGSTPKLIETLIKDDLIEVLGISIKGISAEIAERTANIKNRNLCWENVFETLNIASKYHIKTIVTMVFYKGVPIENLITFVDLLEKYPDVHMKINNLLITEFQGLENYEKYGEGYLKDALEDLLIARPHWKGRITLVNSNEATTENSAVIFL